MSLGTLATIVLDGDHKAGLEAAIETARRLSMHLDVICVAAASFHVPLPTMADAFVPPSVGVEHAADLIKRETAVRDRLAREDIEWSVSAAPIGPDALIVALARHLRFADLILIPRAGPASGDLTRVFESVLYNSRVPILLSEAGLNALDRIVLAWDNSDVALTAIRAAAPIIRAATEVEIVTVDLPDAGEDVAQMLSKLGTAPLLTRLPRGEGAVAEVLLSHAQATGAELIVAGAYGHTRLRDLVLGGVTRHLLRQSDLPLLLAR